MANSWDTDYSSNMGDPQSMQQQPMHQQYHQEDQAATPLYDQQQHQQGRQQFQKRQSPGQTSASTNPQIPRTNSNNGLQLLPPPPPPRPNQPTPAGLSRGSSTLSTTSTTPSASYSSQEGRSTYAQPPQHRSQEVEC